jgi:hypothetical protein
VNARAAGLERVVRDGLAQSLGAAELLGDWSRAYARVLHCAGILPSSSRWNAFHANPRDSVTVTPAGTSYSTSRVVVANDDLLAVETSPARPPSR